MNRPEENAQDRRELLRRYLLGTLASEEKRRVEERLELSGEWQADLAGEKRVIETLDSLPEVLPPQGLDRAVMDRIVEKQLRRKASPVTVLIRVAACLALFCVAAVFILPALSRAHESARRSSTQNNLKQMGLVFKMYANEAPGQLFPPIAPVDGLWAFDVPALFPAYITEPAIFTNVESSEANELIERLSELMNDPVSNRAEAARLVARQFAYFGWCVQNESDVEMMVEARKRLNSEQLNEDIVVGERRLPRLGDNVRLDAKETSSSPAALAKATSEIPVLIQVEPGIPKAGRNVLFLDGHVEYKSLGEFPNTENVQNLLGLKAAEK